MKYIVTFKADDGKLFVKNEIFTSLIDAEKYADSIAESREATITPYLPMNGGSGGKYGIDDHDIMADTLEELRTLFIFSYEDAGCAPMAEHHIIQAYNHMSNAVQSLKMAALTQARETR